MNTKAIDRAKAVVAEIVQQSPGDELVGTVRLYKAFYLAHLFYARKNAGYLTDWPIVKMPQGPGIGDFDELKDRLVAEGVLEIGSARVGPYNAVKYRAISGSMRQLEPEAMTAVREAVEFIADKTGAQLSDITHEFSRSWLETGQGEELSIYIDFLSNEGYDAAKARAELLQNELTTAWND